MNNLCQACHNRLFKMGRDVELYGSKPLTPRPCVMCSAETRDYLVPWSDWQMAPYYPVS